MVERIADKAKVYNIAKMGEELGEVYSALWQETTDGARAPSRA